MCRSPASRRRSPPLASCFVGSRRRSTRTQRCRAMRLASCRPSMRRPAPVRCSPPAKTAAPALGQPHRRRRATLRRDPFDARRNCRAARAPEPRSVAANESAGLPLSGTFAQEQRPGGVAGAKRADHAVITAPEVAAVLVEGHEGARCGRVRVRLQDCWQAAVRAGAHEALADRGVEARVGLVEPEPGERRWR